MTRIKQAIEYARSQYHDSTVWHEEKDDEGQSFEQMIDAAIEEELACVRAATIEECAKVAEAYRDFSLKQDGGERFALVCEALANDIRSLSKVKP